MNRTLTKITGIFLLFVLINLSLVGQGVQLSTNFPESLDPGQSFDVEVNITKGSVSSFAKFQMDLPFGFTAAQTDVKGGNWSFDQQRVKIVWVSVPADPSFKAKFKITVPTNALNSCVITAKFFYLENSVKKEAEMTPVNIKIGKGTGTVGTNTVVETNTVATNTVVETNTVATNTVVETNTVATNTVVETNTVAATNTVVATNTTVTTNSVTPVATGIVYRVQLGAYSSKPSKSKFSGVKDFWIYQDNGLFKATAGVFKTLNEAETYKAQLKGQGMDGFVVVFQNGVRVKLQ